METQSSSTIDGRGNQLNYPSTNTDEDVNSSTANVQDHGDPNVYTSLNEQVPPVSDPIEPTTNAGNILESDVTDIKFRLMSQLNGDITHIDDSSIVTSYQIVFNILEKTVAQRERHSLLLVGPRSSGKSTIVKKALDRLRKEFLNEFLVIQLNASIHSDDNAAVREIARQLDLTTKRQFDKEGGGDLASSAYHIESTIERKSIHETFANILNVLNINLENKEESQNKLLPLIFVVDEFEKFTSNSKQTLLYNLLDMSQSSEIPITVIGLTTKINARDNMEKRVNSRFSQRIMSVLPTTKYPDFLKNAISPFLLNDAFVKSMNAPHYGKTWNENVRKLLQEDEKGMFHALCLRNFNTIKNYREINNVLKILLSEISISHPYFDTKMLDHVIQRYTLVGNLQSAVNSLSDSELLLLVAAAKWAEKFNSPTINFNLAFAEYKLLMKESDSLTSASFSLNSMKVNKKHWSKKALRNSWEVLFNCNLLIEPSSTLSGTQSLSTERRTIKTVMVDDNAMVLLEITLDELNILISDGRLARRLLQL